MFSTLRESIRASADSELWWERDVSHLLAAKHPHHQRSESQEPCRALPVWIQILTDESDTRRCSTCACMGESAKPVQMKMVRTNDPMRFSLQKSVRNELLLLLSNPTSSNSHRTGSCDAVMQISEPVNTSDSLDAPMKNGFSLVDTAPGRPSQKAGDGDSADNLHFHALQVDIHRPHQTMYAAVTD